MFNLGAFLSYAFVVTFTPGPNNIMSMANASKHGYKKNLKFSFGVCTGFFLILMLTSYFNLLLQNILPNVTLIMKVIGTTYMLYLATKIMDIHLPFSKQKKQDDTSHDQVDAITYKTGVMLQFLNPKAILFGLTIVANFIMPYFDSSLSYVGFALFLSLLAFGSTSLWALFGSFFNRFMENHKRPVNTFMGLLLIYSAFTISGLIH